MQPSYFQERKYRRFSVRLPVHVMFNVAGSVSELQAISNNVSLCGILQSPFRSITSLVLFNLLEKAKWCALNRISPVRVLRLP